jgi:inner membrane protein
MEPVTHALASLALARTGLGRITRFATPMLLVSGLAADLDWLTYAGGARDFLAGHRTATHSIVGTIVIAGITAALFTIFSRRLVSHRHPLGAASTGAVPIRFFRASAVCAVGAATHVILDLTNSYGIKLLWPFQQKWYALDLAGSVDPLLLVLLGAGVLVPVVFRLVTEEIGGRAPDRKGHAGTIAALLVIALYFGGRVVLHERTIALLSSRIYAGEPPLRVSGLPQWSPFDWRGLVETETAIGSIDVSLSPGQNFNPETARMQFKPPASSPLDIARQTATARDFLAFARYPFATVQPISSGSRMRIRDLRFEQNPEWPGSVTAVIDLNSELKVTRETLKFETAEPDLRHARRPIVQSPPAPALEVREIPRAR